MKIEFLFSFSFSPNKTGKILTLLFPCSIRRIQSMKFVVVTVRIHCYTPLIKVVIESIKKLLVVTQMGSSPFIFLQKLTVTVILFGLWHVIFNGYMIYIGTSTFTGTTVPVPILWVPPDKIREVHARLEQNSARRVNLQIFISYSQAGIQNI